MRICRALCSGAAVLTVGVLIAACGGDDSEKPAPPNLPSSEQPASPNPSSEPPAAPNLPGGGPPLPPDASPEQLREAKRRACEAQAAQATSPENRQRLLDEVCSKIK